MSFNLNRVHLAGRLVADPVSRSYEGGSVTNWSLAINRKYKDREETVFVDISAFGKTAEIVMQYLKKGSGVYVEGRLQLDKWQTKEGEARQRLKVVADNCQFTGDDQVVSGGAMPGNSHQVHAAPPAPATVDEDSIPF